MYSKEQTWQYFSEAYQLNSRQIEQYQQYYTLLQTANQQFDLTALTDLPSILSHHFADSLEIGKCIDLSTIDTIVDVGTGAGFPGLALKIKYPHLKVILIEVLQKRVRFLQAVIKALGLEDVTIYSSDWRTFLRKTNYPVDLICSRASLAPQELIRMFQPASPYKNAQLAYWASGGWEPTEKERSLIRRMCEYMIQEKIRKYVIFSCSGEEK